MRILGIDYGTKRIGLAITDDKCVMALPLSVLSVNEDARGEAIEPHKRVPHSENTASAAERIADIVKSENIGKIVVGLPYRYNDNIGKKAQEVLKFIEELKQYFNGPIETYDERLTTVESQHLLRDVKLSREKKRKHTNAVAAQLILQRYLDENH